MLINTSGIFLLSTFDFGTDSLFYDSIIISSTILAFIFAREFLETKKYLPSFHIVLTVFLMLLIIELFLTILYHRVITLYFPFSLFLVTILIVSLIRYRQNFKPALYFFLGWFCLIASVAYSELFPDTLSINPMFMGSPLEAILVAFALTYSIRQLQEEQKVQQSILIHQSKLAAMGELLGNIAHQWRQPITNLSYIFMNIKASTHNTDYVNQKSDEGMNQLQFMSDTIENFRNFYQPNMPKESFNLHEQVLYTLDIIQSELERHAILVEITLIEDTELYSYKHQFVQALLSILMNTKDALVASGTSTPFIKIEIEKNNIRIYDNAGGIPDQYIDKIFEPYFSTKEKHSGIGLYMCKIIIEKNLHANISVTNSSDGALFEITF
jgi:signal transduction histidine kinase